MVFSFAAVTLSLVFGLANADRGTWWHHTHYAERVFQARAYKHTLNETAKMLPSVKARGYSVVNLDWPVMAGPVQLYGGFGPKDYYHVEPLIGSDDDWLTFLKAAHALDMKVVSWFNPSYFWTGAPIFKHAEADVAKYGANLSSLPANSAARWFRWNSECDGAVVKPADADAGSYYNGKGRWVQDPDAGNACYWSIFSDQPSGDLDSPEWRDEVKKIFAHWVDTGIDGFILDAPYDYIGVGPPSPTLDASKIRDVIINPVHAKRHGQVAVFGEEYSFREPDLARSLDGSIIGDWVVEGGLPTFDVPSLIRKGTAHGIDAMLVGVDTLAAVGSVARTRPDFCATYEGLDQTAVNALQGATVAALGGFYTVTGTCQDDVGAGIGDFGDYEPLVAEEQIAPVLRAVHSMEAMQPGSPRLPLSVNSSSVYVALRGGFANRHAVLVVLNFQNLQQTVEIDMGAVAVKAQFPRDLLGGGSGSQIIGGKWTVSMPPLGFRLYGVELEFPSCSDAIACGALEGPVVNANLDQVGISDWIHFGAGDRPANKEVHIQRLDNRSDDTSYFDGLNSFSWTGSVALNSARYDRTGVRSRSGFSFEINPPRYARDCVLHVYASAHNAQARLHIRKFRFHEDPHWEGSLPNATGTTFFGHYMIKLPRSQRVFLDYLPSGHSSSAYVGMQAIALNCDHVYSV